MIVTFGECQLNLDARELRVAEKSVHLTPKAFDLLRLLVENRGRVLSKAEILARVWPGTFVTEDSLPRLVTEIRNAIGDSARAPTWLRTIHGLGYAFATPSASDPAIPAAPSHIAIQCGARQFLLAQGMHVIGRDDHVAIPMYSSKVSRRHACVVVTEASVVIEDLGSKNGTFVGDERIDGRRELHEGDEIRVGEFTLSVRSVAAPATETLVS